MFGLKLPVVIFSFLQYSALCHLNSKIALFLWRKSKLKPHVQMKLEFNFCFQWVLWKKSHSYKGGELTSSLKWRCRYWTHFSARACSWSEGPELAHVQCVSTARDGEAPSLCWSEFMVGHSPHKRVPLVPGDLQLPTALRYVAWGQSSTMRQ